MCTEHGPLQNPAQREMPLYGGVDGVCRRFVGCIEGERPTRENLP
jgi:hypothetical protein